jgi:hypothetical protein
LQAQHHNQQQHEGMNTSDAVIIEQEEYEEDHADEERMFSEMDVLLTNPREIMVQEGLTKGPPTAAPPSSSSSSSREKSSSFSLKGDSKAPVNINSMAASILEHSRALSQHLMAHLEKEEKQCLPLVVKHLSKEEVHELVGDIMGLRCK